MRFSQQSVNINGIEDDINAKIDGVNKSFGHHLSISVTKRCPLRCEHCIVSSLPSNDKSLDLPDSVANDLIHSFQLLTPKLRQISFTGGEPFLRTDIIRKISDAGKEYEIASGAVTSASWASNEEKAKRVLAELPALTHITISSDVYHEEYLPRRNIRHAIKAAEQLGVSFSIRISLPEVLSEVHEKHLKEVKKEFGDSVHTQQVVEFGRGENLGLNNALVEKPPSLPCLSSGPHIAATGRVVPCCSTLDDNLPVNHPLNLGDASKDSVLKIINQSHNNNLLSFIRLWGFRDVMDKLHERFPEKFSNMRFVEEAQCTLCATLMHDEEVVGFLSDWINEIEQVANVAVGVWAHFGNREPLFQLKNRAEEIEAYRELR